jgi:glycosyltransferase involved in cell wall biosynthesis
VTDPEVSVILAVYNGERFLRDALESICAQDFDSYEVVVVDDGSTDGTEHIAHDFPVRYRNQPNAGSSVARNMGLAMARGRLVAFLDHDDVVPPSKLRVQVEHLRAHADVDCVLGRQEWLFEDDTDPPELGRDPVFGDLGGIALGSAMIRRDVLEDVGGFDPSYHYAEDRDLFVRLREHGASIVVLPDVVLYRRLHEANKTLSPPEHHPLLRSLREKLARDRSTNDGAS